MSCPIDWSLRMKRKDGKPLTHDEIEAIFNCEEWREYFSEDNVTMIGADDTEMQADFFTESYSARDIIHEFLLEDSKAHPEYVFETERNYEGVEYYLDTFYDGAMNTVEGQIVYPGAGNQTKIRIIVKEGLVQSVYCSDAEVDVEVIDLDNEYTDRDESEFGTLRSAAAEVRRTLNHVW